MIDISYHDFRKLFYPNNSEFSPNFMQVLNVGLSRFHFPEVHAELLWPLEKRRLTSKN